MIETQKPLPNVEQAVLFSKLGRIIKDFLKRGKAADGHTKSSTPEHKGQPSNKEKDQQKAQEMAERAVMEFMAGEVQKPLKSIFPNKYQLDVAIKELAPKDTTILRLDGHVRHRYVPHYWFCNVRIEDNIFFFMVQNQPGETLQLTPDGVTLTPEIIQPMEKIGETIPIKFALNYIIDIPYDDEIANSDAIHVMFSGSPEVTKEAQKAEVKELAPVGQLQPQLQ